MTSPGPPTRAGRGLDFGPARPPSSVSVIVTTYQQPEWLERVLWGYRLQSFRDFELIVADDGSGAETRAVVERLREGAPFPIRHLWLEDRGFRKCDALNHAVLAARGEYLVFSDGDCVPRDDFVETHVRLARPGRFLSGGALRLSEATSRRLGIGQVRSGEAMRLSWLLRNGWRPGHRILRVTRRRGLARALDFVTPTRAKWNGGNASVWRAALFDVNGFDAKMGYKGQDRALGDRLTHLGWRGAQVRHRCVVLHLDHARPYAIPERMEENHRIRRRILERKEIWAEDGIAQLNPAETVER